MSGYNSNIVCSSTGGLKNVMAEQLEGLLSNPGIKPEMVIVSRTFGSWLYTATS